MILAQLTFLQWRGTFGVRFFVLSSQKHTCGPCQLAPNSDEYPSVCFVGEGSPHTEVGRRGPSEDGKNPFFYAMPSIIICSCREAIRQHARPSVLRFEFFSA